MKAIERLYNYFDENNIIPTRIEKEIGLSNGYLSTAKKRGADIGESMMTKILDRFPDLSADYLLKGSSYEAKDDLNIVNEPTKDYITKIGVPYYDIDFVGGFDLVLNDQTINPSYYINYAPFNDADCWVNITGKSMSPLISHGDLVALKQINSWKEFILLGEIYAIITKEFRTIKRLAAGETKDCFTLMPYSKSPEFSNQQLPKNMITHIFKVKGSIKRFD